MYDIFGKYGSIRQIRAYHLASTFLRFFILFIEEQHRIREEQHTLYMMIYLMQRQHVNIFKDLM